MDGTDHHLRAVAAAGYYLTRVLALMVAAALDTGSVASPQLARHPHHRGRHSLDRCRSRIVNLLTGDLHKWSVGEAVMPASPRQSPRVAYAGREAWLIRGLDAATARQREAVDPA